jgi:hypothetical protein
MKLIVEVLPRGFKQFAAIIGLLLALPGLLVGFGFLCLTLILVVNGDSDAVIAGLWGFGLAALTLGTGVTLFWHSIASLEKKVSKPLGLLSPWGFVGIFVAYIVVENIFFQSDVFMRLLFPPTLIIIAAIPPLFAVSLFMNRKPDAITWRKGATVFIVTTTISLIFVLVVEGLLMVIWSMSTFNPFEAMVHILDYSSNLFNQNLVLILTRQNIGAFIHFVIIIPLVGALIKPFAALPFLGQLSRRESFLLGAIAGAGYTTLETIILISLDVDWWIRTLTIVAVGSAIHPLGAGLVTLAWRDLFKGEADSWPKWLARFGFAAALSMLWNLGFFTLVSTQPVFGNWLLLGVTNIALLGLGVVFLWQGWSFGQKLIDLEKQPIKRQSIAGPLPVTDYGIAVWAVACLLGIVPAGYVLLQFLK